MVFSTDDATADEPVLGAVPTKGELGRQVKRLKTSTILNSVTATLPMVPDDMIGARFARAADMAAEIAVNIPGEPLRHRELLTAITNATRRTLEDSCAPGGAFWNCMAAVEQRSIARLHNSTKHGGTELLQPLLGVNNTFPPEFPASYESFSRMSGACAESLILAYGLSREGTEVEKLKKLSAYCNVNLPK